MNFFYILFIAFLNFSCSENIENNKASKKNTLPIEKKIVHSQNIQSKPSTDGHISGSNAPRVSGAPSSPHISGVNK